MPPFDPDSANFITNSEIFVADSAGSPVFRAILSKTVFKLYVHEIHNSKECKKNSNVAYAANLFSAC